jgi:putative CocE/NonD family hydrolase
VLSEESTRIRVQQAADHFERSLWDLPLTSWPPVDGLADSYWQALSHPDDCPYWWSVSVSRVHDRIDVPILHLTSWYDSHQSGGLRAFVGIRARGRSAACREAQRLIVGPWMHGEPYLGQRQFGEVDFGPEAPIDLHALRLRWYDYWLKGIETGILDTPPVRLFLMGTNRWLACSDWPPPDVTYRSLHLRSGAEPGQGSLTFDDPPVDDPPDSFVYDPAEPVPSLVSSFAVRPVDCRPIEDRVLLYESDVLQADLHVVGPVKAVLYAASSARDTDWIVRLCDVWPDGRSLLVCDGILRARYRESFERQVLMEPGQVYRFEVDLRATAQTFRAGHRLLVHVTSSDFPRYDRNLNTGGMFAQESEFQFATNSVFHDAVRPSHLVLPILSNEAVEAALTDRPG